MGCDTTSAPAPAMLSAAAPSASARLSTRRVLVAEDAGVFREGVVLEQRGDEVRFGTGSAPGSGVAKLAQVRGLPADPEIELDAGRLGACRTGPSEWQGCELLSREPEGWLAQVVDGRQPSVKPGEFVDFDGGVATYVKRQLATASTQRELRLRLQRLAPPPVPRYVPQPTTKVLVRFDVSWAEALLLARVDGGAAFEVRWFAPGLAPSVRDVRDIAQLPRLPPPKVSVGDLLLARKPSGVWEPVKVLEVEDQELRVVPALGGPEREERLDKYLLPLSERPKQ